MEQEKTSDKINYLRFATAFLFLHAAGGLGISKRNGMNPAKTMEEIPASQIAQDKMISVHKSRKKVNIT